MKFDIRPIFVLATILILNIVFRLTLPFLNTGLWWDEAVYLGLARNIAENGKYSINTDVTEFQKFYEDRLVFDESFRPPLLPFILSIFNFLGKDSQSLVSPLFSVISIVLTFIISKKLFGMKIGLLSAIFLIISPLYFFFGERTLTESLFACLAISIFYFFILSLRREKFLPIAFLLIGLAFLTRYPALIFIPLFFVLVIIKKKTKILFSKNFLFSILIFLLVLSPWFYFNIKTYSDFLGGLKISYQELEKSYYRENFLFYLRNYLWIFGFSGLFIVFSIHKIRKNELIKFFLLAAIMILIVFSLFFERKELRYLVSFTPIFSVLFSVGFVRLQEQVKVRSISLTIFFLFILADLWFSANNFLTNMNSGQQIRQAGEFLKDKDTNYVIAENYPVINYFSGKKTLPFPADESAFWEIVQTYNISFIVIDNLEPTTPEYTSEIAKDLQLVKQFTLWNQTANVFKVI